MGAPNEDIEVGYICEDWESIYNDTETLELLKKQSAKSLVADKSNLFWVEKDGHKILMIKEEHIGKCLRGSKGDLFAALIWLSGFFWGVSYTK
jgi:hypothetical protein